MSNSTNPPEAVKEAALADGRPVSELGDELADAAQPLAERFRVLFTLRNVGGQEAVDAIARAFEDESVLLKHEVAYVLGQMGETAAIPVLSQVLEDTEEDCMVRHEAGEALGAIGDASALEILRKYAQDPDTVVAETCELAVALLEWKQTHSEEAEAANNNPYLSVDPAPPAAPDSVETLKNKLCDTELPLFERYRALFALRNEGSEEAVLAICSAFTDASALFRHELAYVLGQMQHPASVDALGTVLQDSHEHGMVRHEAAEALGSIATDTCTPILQTFQEDDEAVVRESCQVALDMAAYEQSGAFEYVVQ